MTEDERFEIEGELVEQHPIASSPKSKEAWMMTDDDCDHVAEAIYRNSGGLTDEDYLMVMGIPRLQWKTDAEWDTNPDELTEHERDDYRMMARAAITAYLTVKR